MKTKIRMIFAVIEGVVLLAILAVAVRIIGRDSPCLMSDDQLLDQMAKDEKMGVFDTAVSREYRVRHGV